MKLDSWAEHELERGALSALVDGEANAAEMAACCQTWRSDPEVRQAWHAWAVIGDVMRSEDLATDPARDAAFLTQLRSRLSVEPVVLAPSPTKSPAVAGSEKFPAGAIGARPRPRPWARGASTARPAWRRPVAAVAFLAVVGSFAVTRTQFDGEATSIQMSGGTVGVPNMVRNAELDRYLAAHRQFSQTAALANPNQLLPVVIRAERP